MILASIVFNNSPMKNKCLLTILYKTYTVYFFSNVFILCNKSIN